LDCRRRPAVSGSSSPLVISEIGYSISLSGPPPLR
jgi:hypothetical protein